MKAQLRSSRNAVSSLAGALFVLGLLFGSGAEGAQALTRVFIDGRPASVSFNDGDTFRVQDGPLAGTTARLAGYNTLESYGAVHQFGTWHPYELWIIAKKGTLNARRGTWRCNSNGMQRDGYGRALFECPNLIVDQLKKGYAFALNIDDTPARPEYLAAQHEAMQARRGMWAHGTPEFVVTSLHSFDEDPSRSEAANRVVSTRDGHSEMWKHRDVYRPCEWVCRTLELPDHSAVSAVARTLRQSAATQGAVADLSNLLLTEIVSRFARTDTLPKWVTPESSAALTPALAEAKTSGALGALRSERVSCMLNVEMSRRFGRNRASCLDGRGTTP